MESNGRLYRRQAQGRCRARNQQNGRQLKHLHSLQFLLIDFSVQICCQHGLLVSKKINNQGAVIALMVQRLAACAISGAMLHEFPGLDRTLALRRSNDKHNCLTPNFLNVHVLDKHILPTLLLHGCLDPPSFPVPSRSPDLPGINADSDVKRRADYLAVGLCWKGGTAQGPTLPSCSFIQ